MVMSKSKLVVMSIITVLLLSLFVSFVAAQYTTQKTTDVAISSDGTFSATVSDVGVSYLIQGTSGATGTVTATVYTGNPQPTAAVPAGTSLSRFVVITFDMNANEFTQATITINYSDSDVQNIQPPFTIFKYVPGTDSFVALPSTVDSIAQTLTITVTSLDDPLFAIGGAATATAGFPDAVWGILVVCVVAIVVFAGFVVSRLHRPDENVKSSVKS
jgi:hypothetical protein